MPKTELELLSAGMALAQEKAPKSDSRFWASNPQSKGNFIALAKGELSLNKPKPTLENLPELEFDTEAAGDVPGLVSSDVFTTREAFKERKAEADMTIEERIKAEGDKKRQIIADQFAPRIAEAEKYREDITESVEGQFATKRRLSTAALSYVQFNRDEAQKKVNEIENQKNIALANLDITLADKLEKEKKAWQDEEKYWIDLENDQKKQQFNQFIALEQLDISKGAAARAGEAHIFDTIIKEFNVIKDIEVGKSVEIGGYTFVGIDETIDPFFKSSDLVSIMKDLPEGQSKEITDPNTGTVYLLQGLSSEVYTVTDDQGNVTGLDKATGKPKWKAEGVGKTKTRAASTTIIMNETQTTALQDARKILEQSIGEDGFYNSDQYKYERQRFVEITGKPALFDEQFKTFLNPTDPSNVFFFDTSELQEDGTLKYSDAVKQALKDEFGYTEEEITNFELLGIDLTDL